MKGMQQASSRETSGFFADVWAVAARVPCGKVTTYGAIARALGAPRAARTVGWAMRACPDALGVPCHRVINSAGELAPGEVFGGPEAQRSRLEQEGVTFRPDGKVDLRHYLWQP